MNKQALIRETFDKGNGILRLMPVFVPRRFSKSGGRLKLHPDDQYALGTARGSIKERWFSSVICCQNGEHAAEDEGMSYVETTGNPADKISLKDFVDTLGAEIIGYLQERYGTWPMYSKFFDYNDPLFHHLHLDFDAAARVGKIGKPEAYYYPPQLNNHPGTFPHTYFGFSPDVTKDEVRERLLAYESGDNRITELSRAYRIELSTGWYTPPGVVHAPGSYLTYEPQWNSDVNSVYENIASSEVYPYSFLSENCPPDKMRDVDYIMDLMDWEKNIDPDYRKTYFRPPVVAEESDKHIEKWVCYGNDYIAAKELTVYPGQTVTVADKTAFGCIFVQGHGKFGAFDAETPVLLRFGGMSADEYFVSEQAAQNGIVIQNNSPYDPIVILKHFPASHPDTPKAGDCVC